MGTGVLSVPTGPPVFWLNRGNRCSSALLCRGLAEIHPCGLAGEMAAPVDSLVAASEAGDLDMVERILAPGRTADADTLTDSLCRASARGRLEVISKLVAAGADPNRQSQQS